VNNLAAKKRPCGPLMAWCGVAYLLVMVLLFAFSVN
jgi:hypothetical protein